MAEVLVSLVTDEMVTRAYHAFMGNVTAVTPQNGPDGFIPPYDAMRKALEAALAGPDLDGAVAELHPQPDGTMAAEIRIPGPAVP